LASGDGGVEDYRKFGAADVGEPLVLATDAGLQESIGC
jgi:hypothetical protein